MNSASGIEPWSPLPRVRTLTASGRFFLVAEDQDVRRLLVGEVADLGVHLLVAVVHFHAQARGLQLGLDLFARSRDAAR